MGGLRKLGCECREEGDLCPTWQEIVGRKLPERGADYSMQPFTKKNAATDGVRMETRAQEMRASSPRTSRIAWFGSVRVIQKSSRAISSHRRRRMKSLRPS